MNRILIVEDEVPIAQLIEMSLARAGYQCEAVNDGCAAADKIEQNDYDLVLLDIMLPRFSPRTRSPRVPLAVMKMTGVPMGRRYSSSS